MPFLDPLRARIEGNELTDDLPANSDAGVRRFSILIAPFSGAEGNAAAQHVKDRLTGFARLNTEISGRALMGGGDIDRPARLSMAIDLGRHRLQRAGADLLIWGDMTPNSCRLRLLAPEPSVSPRLASLGALNHLDLPTLFGDGHGHVLAACALAALVPEHAEDQALRTNLFARILPTATDFVETALSGSVGQTASLLTAQGALQMLAGLITNDPRALNRAADTFRSVLILSSDALLDHEKGLIYAHLGDACAASGALKGDAEDLKTASEAYRTARDLMPSRSLLEETAGIKARLGLVLHDLARETGEAHYFGDAAEAMMAAAQVWSRERNPTHWAEIQNAVAGLFYSLAQARQTSAPLDQAEQVLHAVLNAPELADHPLIMAVSRANMAVVMKAHGTAEAAEMAQSAARDFEAVALPALAAKLTSVLDTCSPLK